MRFRWKWHRRLVTTLVTWPNSQSDRYEVPSDRPTRRSPATVCLRNRKRTSRRLRRRKNLVGAIGMTRRRICRASRGRTTARRWRLAAAEARLCWTWSASECSPASCRTPPPPRSRPPSSRHPAASATATCPEATTSLDCGWHRQNTSRSKRSESVVVVSLFSVDGPAFNVLHYAVHVPSSVIAVRCRVYLRLLFSSFIPVHYSVSQKKVHFTFDHNFRKCGPIFKTRSLADSQWNSVCYCCLFFHLTLTVLLHYLAKFTNLIQRLNFY